MKYTLFIDCTFITLC